MWLDHIWRRNCMFNYVFINFVFLFSDGIPFFLSVNDVVLSPGNTEGIIAIKYFYKVLDVTSGNDF